MELGKGERSKPEIASSLRFASLLAMTEMFFMLDFWTLTD